MDTLHILAYILAALFIIRLLYIVYDYYKPSPKKEKYDINSMRLWLSRF